MFNHQKYIKYACIQSQSYFLEIILLYYSKLYLLYLMKKEKEKRKKIKRRKERGSKLGKYPLEHYLSNT